ncbi:patatin-like phospholipase family protein [Echinicola vietnamensis]|uniref:Putative esterase of the alpha-beta hydrolase superfamily n=1 Tax=Echinicola vietnamensis (strain DSM 17526 / LMG 23754 / KMM 6221) TaxID=926556 RepID=L0FU94_ECHVK|nr:patatin-like phospholipase family protein [Echinicola vietnamensis]AGA77469.1 putative esterase of the alpha-beta hydrolase superfamily [Echinicola vietnamensis DSM 17526]
MGKKTVSLVLSSGGARGLAHIGVIEALEEHGYSIQAIAGCSMGALIGGIYARGKLNAYKEWICNLDRIDVFSLMDFTISTRGFIKGNKVFQAVEALVGDELIENLPIPFACNAVNIFSGEEVTFSQGSLFQAIRASAAIPTVFKPYVIGQEEFVDGALLNPIPVNMAKDFDSDLLIASDVNAPIACLVRAHQAQKDGRPLITVPQWVTEYRAKMARFFPQERKEKPKSPSFLDLMNLSFEMMQDRLSDYILQAHTVDAVVQMSRKQCGTFEFYRAKEIIEVGKDLTHATLKQLDL